MLFLATVCLLISAALCAPAKGGLERGRQPNIVLFLADDLGYNDVGFNGSPDIQTPNLDALAAEGVILKNYYVQPICSPSRSQLLSGVHETVSGLCHSVIRSSQRLGLPLNLPTLPQKLRDVGYATHLIGKWHLGHHETSFLPTHRGFDTFLGCVNGLTEQYTHRPFERFFNSTGALNTFIGHDMFEGDAPLYGLEGQHTTDIYTNRFEKLLKDHMEATPHKPFFIDVAFTAPHSPLQAPDRFVAQYSNVQDINRRLFSAMVSHLDEAVGNMTRAIKSYGGLWQNTIIIFSTDNGGPVNFGADNFPLRGGKATFFEGGIKGASFITSPLIHQRFRGKTNNAWLHISDWYPTLISLAGGDVSGQRLNGFNVWPSINGIFPSPRVEQLINIDNSPAAGLWGAERSGSPFDVRIMGAIRVGQWKLITGNPGTTPHWYNTPNSIPNVTILPRVGGLEFVSGLGEAEVPGYIVRTSTDSSTKNVWLFDVVNDPYEYNDLSATYPFIVDFLLTRLAYYNQFIAAPGVCAYPRMDMLANPDLRGGAFGPWASNNLPPPQY